MDAMIDAYVYEGKFESTQINLSLTGKAPLGGIGGLRLPIIFYFTFLTVYEIKENKLLRCRFFLSKYLLIHVYFYYLFCIYSVNHFLCPCNVFILDV